MLSDLKRSSIVPLLAATSLAILISGCGPAAAPESGSVWELRSPNGAEVALVHRAMFPAVPQYSVAVIRSGIGSGNDQWAEVARLGSDFPYVFWLNDDRLELVLCSEIKPQSHVVLPEWQQRVVVRTSRCTGKADILLAEVLGG